MKLKKKIQKGGSGFKATRKKVEIRGKLYVKSSKASFQEDLSVKAKEQIRAKRKSITS